MNTVAYHINKQTESDMNTMKHSNNCLFENITAHTSVK